MAALYLLSVFIKEKYLRELNGNVPRFTVVLYVM